MNVVHKHQFDEQLLVAVLPWGPGARVLHVAAQDLNDPLPTAWALRPDAATLQRALVLVPTGSEFDPLGLEFVGSAVCAGGALVWHVFAAEPVPASAAADRSEGGT